MKKNGFKKRYITLVEMMIVMFLIAMITGVIAYNYTGSLEEGKAFKTKNGIDKIHTVLDLYLASHPNEADSIDSQWQEILRHSQLVKNPNDLINDGWGVPYVVARNGSTGEIEITSERYSKYQEAKGKGSLFNKQSQ